MAGILLVDLNDLAVAPEEHPWQAHRRIKKKHGVDSLIGYDGASLPEKVKIARSEFLHWAAEKQWPFDEVAAVIGAPHSTVETWASQAGVRRRK
jgi:hypothetical protein